MTSPMLGALTISVEDGGTIRQVERQLLAWGDTWHDMSEAWEQVGEYVLSQNMLNQIGQGALYAHGGWVPLADSTVAGRVSAGWGAGPIMWRSGRLAQSLSQRGAEGNIFEVRPDGWTGGSSIEYASYQHDGTSTIPARALIGLSWDGEQQVVRTLQDWLNEQARMAGLLVVE